MTLNDFIDKMEDHLDKFSGWCFLSGILGTLVLIGLGPWWLVVMIIRHWPK